MNICVYCGSRSGDRPEYEAAAIEVGKEIVNRGWGLVYGGGGIGLMGVVARTVYDAGLPVIGIIPTFLATREIAFWECTELIEVPSMHVRKQLMIDRSDMLLAMPGGFGTMDELFEAITWRQLGLHDRPIGLLNVDGYYDPLLAMNTHMVDRNFVYQRHADLLVASADVTSLFDALSATSSDAPSQLPGRT